MPSPLGPWSQRRKLWEEKNENMTLMKHQYPIRLVFAAHIIRLPREKKKSHRFLGTVRCLQACGA